MNTFYKHFKNNDLKYYFIESDVQPYALNFNSIVIKSTKVLYTISYNVIIAVVFKKITAQPFLYNVSTLSVIAVYYSYHVVNRWQSILLLSIRDVSNVQKQTINNNVATSVL